MSNRRIFTEEFKAGAVQLVVSSGRSVKEVATELGIKEGTLGAWVRTWRAEHPDAGVDEPGPVEWAKYKARQAENAALKRENEFLGKASAFFGSRSTCRGSLSVHRAGEGVVSHYMDVQKVGCVQSVVLPVGQACGSDSDSHKAFRTQG